MTEIQHDSKIVCQDPECKCAEFVSWLDRMTEHSLGMECARCEKRTGNWHQGHYWGLCKATRTIREMHFCCPDNCELEVEKKDSEKSVIAHDADMGVKVNSGKGTW